MPDIAVAEEGVAKLLRRACGPDMIPARILKELTEEISLFQTTLFQKSLDSGAVPDDLRSANVSVISKKRDRFKASHDRSVPLTSLCCKVQEHIITKNILKYLEKHDVLTGCQHGFRACRSC